MLAKERTVKYGKLPVKELKENEYKPFFTVQVDLIGPYKLNIQRRRKTTRLHLHALTMMDPTTNFMAIIEIKNKSSEHVSQAFKEAWLQHFP